MLGWYDELDTARAVFRGSERRKALGGRIWEQVYTLQPPFHAPFQSQRLFHEASSRYKGFSGPVGSGKTQALVAEILALAYANPGLPGVVGAPTYGMLRDVTRAAFLETLKAAGVPHVFRKSANEVLLSEPRSLVRFRSLDDPEKLVGSNLAWFGVDELTYCPEDSWRRLEARLRHPKAARLEGFAAWTPKGFDWVYEQFIGPERIKGYDAIMAAPGENKALPPDFYERLKASYDERFYEQEVLGRYLSIFAGQTYYAFDREHNVAPVSFNPRYPLIWALDFNVNPMASVIAQHVGENVHVLQEIILPNSNTPAVCDTFFGRVDALKAFPITVHLYGDPAGAARSHAGADKSDWAIVRAAFEGWRGQLEMRYMVASSAPSVRSRVNAMNAMCRNVHGARRLVIDPSCKELISDLEQVAWKTDVRGNSIPEIDKSNPKRTHVSDALGYYIEKEFGIRQHGGPRSTWIA